MPHVAWISAIKTNVEKTRLRIKMALVMSPTAHVLVLTTHLYKYQAGLVARHRVEGMEVEGMAKKLTFLDSPVHQLITLLPAPEIGYPP